MKHKYMLFTFAVLLLCIEACKTSGVNPQSKARIVGKWFLNKHDLKLIRDSVQVGFSSKTSFTDDDFAQYFADGTGIISFKSGEPTAGLYRFTYKINGIKLTVSTDGGAWVNETITSLTQTKFSIHYETIVPDPYDQVLEKEVDDFEYVR